MKYVLLVASWPKMPHGPAGDGIRAEWSAAQDRFAEVLTRFPEIEEIREGVWQIPLSNGLNGLADVHQSLNVPELNSYGYRVLFFDGIPEWILTSPKR